jgi:hypothetical protein
VKRIDDHDEAVARRLELFFEGSEYVLEVFNDIKLTIDGTAPFKEVLRRAHLYVRPPAPLYAAVSTRPNAVSAEDLKAQFMKRAEESSTRAPAEGEDAAPPEDGGAAGRPPLFGDDFRRGLARDIIDICMGKLFDEEQEDVVVVEEDALLGLLFCFLSFSFLMGEPKKMKRWRWW